MKACSCYVLIPVDGEDAVPIFVLEAEGHAERLEGDAVPRQVFRQGLVVHVVPVMVVLYQIHPDANQS